MSSIIVNNRQYLFGRKTYIMGILNVTPDSFSDGGAYDQVDKALAQGLNMESLGADFLDVGGESTRPTSEPVALNEELARVLPILERLKDKITIPISIDTYKSEVAAKCIELGAGMINDVWGFQKDLNMADVAAQYKVPAVLMHNQLGSSYDQDMIESMKAYFNKSIEWAIKAGVDPKQLILDPGIGFGKTHEQNVLVMRRLSEFKSFGMPLLLGTSRKSLIHYILNLPPKERVNGTIATTVMAVANGYDFVRVHDIRENREAAQVADVIYRR
jgi:dihydropteroate synthase